MCGAKAVTDMIGGQLLPTRGWDPDASLPGSAAPNRALGHAGRAARGRSVLTVFLVLLPCPVLPCPAPQVGKEGVITVQDGKTLENELEVRHATPRCAALCRAVHAGAACLHVVFSAAVAHWTLLLLPGKTAIRLRLPPGLP